MGSCGANVEETQNLTNQQLWEWMAAEVDLWVDGVGYPIDPEIKETVIVFNLLGITTSASCGGHIERAGAYPWVDFNRESTPEIDSFYDEMRLLAEKGEVERVMLEEKFPDLTWNERGDQPEGKLYVQLVRQRNEICNKIDMMDATRLQPIEALLEQFYQTSKSSYGQTLILLHHRLQSCGAEWQQLRSAEEREVKLYEYREEMKSFTEFLKERFFSTSAR